MITLRKVTGSILCVSCVLVARSVGQICPPGTGLGYEISTEVTIADTPTAQEPTPESLTQPSSLSVRAADFNGDGYEDVVLGGNGDPAVIVYWFDANGETSHFEVLDPLDQDMTATCYHLEVEDLNGDDLPDIIVSRHLDSTLSPA